MAEVLIIAEGDIATTQLIERIVAACAPHGVGYRKKLLMQVTAGDFSPGTLPLFIRCAAPAARRWTHALTAAKRDYVFYIDDNFWRIVGDSPLAAYYRHRLVRNSLEFTVANAALVITSSLELARFLEPLNCRIITLPAAFDFSLIDDPPPPSTDEVRIGFAGSSSRVDDLELIAPIIHPILESNPSAVFEFAGVMPRGISACPRIRFFPYANDYASYIRFQRQRNWSIGLAPLLDHEANRCKTDNKYREYGACSCASIFSNIPPYAGVVEDGVTGLLVDNRAGAWEAAVARLLDRPQERTRISEQAAIDVRHRYGLPEVAQAWARVLLQVSAAATANGRAVGLVMPDAGRTRARLDAWRLHLHVLHREGGTAMVVKSIARRIARGFVQMTHAR